MFECVARAVDGRGGMPVRPLPPSPWRRGRVTGHRRWEDIHHKSTPEALEAARAELDGSLNEPFTYRLVVLTHGAGTTLERALTAFALHVTPAPTETVIVVDGPMHDLHRRLVVNWSWPTPVTVEASVSQRGFCTATARAWAEGAKPGVSHVFHLEGDFLITEPVDLRDMAEVLDDNPALAQMSLMRQAVNAAEVAAGGLFELRRDDYEQRMNCVTTAKDVHWLRHRIYATSNPVLMRRDFMEHHPWPDPHVVTAECEGIYGWALREQGWDFGVWGDGTPNCQHVGVRDGIGY